jgi:hypothetical protein
MFEIWPGVANVTQEMTIPALLVETTCSTGKGDIPHELGVHLWDTRLRRRPIIDMNRRG